MNATTTITAGALLKNASYVVVFVATLKFLGITPISAIVLIVFMVTDVITGMIRSYLLNGKDSVKSSVWERGVLSKGLVILVPLGIGLAGKGVGLDAELPLVAQGIINIMIFAEMYSWIGNIYSIRTGKIKKEFDAMNYVLRAIQAMLKKFIKDETL